MGGVSYRYWFILAVLALVTTVVFGCFLLMVFGIVRV